MFPYYRGKNPMLGSEDEAAWSRTHKRLQERIKDARSRTDSKEPDFKLPSLRFRRVMSDDRIDEIDYQNRLLIQRMRDIYKKGGWLSTKPLPEQERKSLNKNWRIRQFDKIEAENQRFIERLSRVQPEVDRSKMLRDFKNNHVKYGKHISRKARDLYERREEDTLRELSQSRKPPSVSSEKSDDEDSEFNLTATDDRSLKKQRIHTGSTQTHRRSSVSTLSHNFAARKLRNPYSASSESRWNSAVP